MKTLKLRDDFYWAGIVDDTLKVFDIIMYTEIHRTVAFIRRKDFVY